MQKCVILAYMVRLLTVVGARPQIIKASALSRAVQARPTLAVEEHLLHTGQHYDAAMSSVFFDELGLPQPRYNLGVGSASHGKQTALMLQGIEEVLLQGGYDGVVAYGDTNSTLAAALAAAKLRIPLFHVEAGLRSQTLSMPEEQNRIVADHLSSICFTPTATATHELLREGIPHAGRRMPDGKEGLVVQCGDVMLDNALHFAPRTPRTAGTHLLATVHRDFNTDNPARLEAIIVCLSNLATAEGLPLLLPLHPRTARAIPDGLMSTLRANPLVRLLPPASYLQMLALERDARAIFTDSGGVQKEAFFVQRPCIILRPNTEWVEIVDAGCAQCADADAQRICNAYHHLCSQQLSFPTLFGDGKAANHILDSIVKYLN